MTISRQTSATGSVVSVATPLQHPTPDLGVLGRYVRNVSHLERSAEELSAGGSDIGERIRELNALSRESSIQSSRQGSQYGRRPIDGKQTLNHHNSFGSSGSGAFPRPNLDRVAGSASASERCASNGSVKSPSSAPSRRSSELSSIRNTSSRKRYRLSHVSERELDVAPLRLSPRSTVAMDQSLSPNEQSRQTSQSSFSRHYDEIASEIESALQHVPPSPPKHQTAEYESTGGQIDGNVTPPDRPRSTDTFREAQTAFQDFDGVHYSPQREEGVEIDEHGYEVRRASARNSTGRLTSEGTSLLNGSQQRSRSDNYEAPPDGTVFYPAPVPRVLNLPKRLSQLPVADVQSKRRSRIIEHLGADTIAGAPWLASADYNAASGTAVETSPQKSDASPGKRISKRLSADRASLPAAIRAQLYFEHEPIRHDIQLKDGSAVATLDSILEASAKAPVRGFTEHPYMPDADQSGPASRRRSRQSAGGSKSSFHSFLPGEKTHKRRSSSIGQLLKRGSSSDAVPMVPDPMQSRSSLPLDLQEDEEPVKTERSNSRLSLETEMDKMLDGTTTPEPDLQHGLIAAAQNASPRDIAQPATSDQYLTESQQIDHDFKEEIDRDDVIDADGEPVFVKPSTLLAELQVRKAQQKSRNRTAATAFPQGMHSTLLQLDAVEEINKRKRKNQRIDLAWEDPHQNALRADIEQEDEDVPLGRLFPGKDGRYHRRVGDGKDFDRPLGLMEKRQVEDEEPLSSRRNRLRGISPPRQPAPRLDRHASMPLQNVSLERAMPTIEDETLDQQVKRTLDEELAATDPSQPARPKSPFADELLSKLGILAMNEGDQKTPQADPGRPTPSPQQDPEETLGERKARLRRERELRSETYQPTRGSLLHSSSAIDTKTKAALHNVNTNASTGGLGRPLVDGRPRNQRALSGLPANEQSRPANGGYNIGTYNNGMGGLQLPTPQGGPMYRPGVQLQASSSTPMLGMSGMKPYFPSPTGMPYAGYGGMMGYPSQMQMQPQMQNMPYQTFNPAGYQFPAGGAMQSGWTGNAYNPGMMGVTYAAHAQGMGGMGAMGGVATSAQDMSADPHYRAAIDRWRAGIGQQ